QTYDRCPFSPAASRCNKQDIVTADQALGTLPPSTTVTVGCKRWIRGAPPALGGVFFSRGYAPQVPLAGSQGSVPTPDNQQILLTESDLSPEYPSESEVQAKEMKVID